MKVNGVEANKLHTVALVLPRGADAPLVFYAEALPDLTEFDKLCPLPVAAQTYTPKGITYNTTAPDYVAALKLYNERRWGYVMMRSLRPSNIEWDTVNAHDCETWTQVEPELRKAVSYFEYGKIVDMVEEANALNATKLIEARDDFFRKAAVAAQ